MADLNQMKAEAARQGAQAPPDYPGGPDEWVKAWYANAKAAGSIVSERPANYAGPNDAEAQGHNYSQNVSGASGWQQGQTINPQQLRKLSQEQGWSEDFNRYSDAQLQAWIDKSWDPQSGRFRSEGGGGALVEKPTECPPGTTLHGSRCVGWDQLPPELGGTGGGGGAPAQQGPLGGAATRSTGNPLQDALVGLYQERGGMFGGSQGGQELSNGGIFWSPAMGGGDGTAPGGAPVNPALAQAALTAFTPAAPSQNPQAAQAAPAAAPAPQTSTFAGALPNITSGVQNKTAAPMVAQPQAQAPGSTAIEASLAKRYTDPNRWWAGEGSPKVA